MSPGSIGKLAFGLLSESSARTEAAAVPAGAGVASGEGAAGCWTHPLKRRATATKRAIQNRILIVIKGGLSLLFLAVFLRVPDGSATRFADTDGAFLPVLQITI
jgi:hypothetical protein